MTCVAVQHYSQDSYFTSLGSICLTSYGQVNFGNYCEYSYTPDVPQVFSQTDTGKLLTQMQHFISVHAVCTLSSF